MTKHIGLHNAKNIIIVLHKMPAEDHMCLILYVDKLPSLYQEAVTRCLNSPEGQAAKNFADALETATLADGRNLARILFTEGHLKKVPTSQVFVTPDSRNKMKLNDLNEYLAKIEEGGEALKKLEEYDKSRGMNRRKKKDLTESAPAVAAAPLSSAITAESLYDQLKNQTEQLTKLVSSLMAEVQNLKNSAPAAAPKKAARAKTK